MSDDGTPSESPAGEEVGRWKSNPTLLWFTLHHLWIHPRFPTCHNGFASQYINKTPSMVVILKPLLPVLDKVVSYHNLVLKIHDHNVASNGVFHHISWCKSGDAARLTFPFLFKTTLVAPNFLLDLSFKYFHPRAKGRNCILGPMSISFSLFPKTFQVNTTSVDSSYVSLTLSLSLSLKQQKRIIYGTQVAQTDKSFSHFAESIETRISGNFVSYLWILPQYRVPLDPC